jgi:NNP family nitrate/nitrite transporter-like MFS transporter
VRRHLGGDPAAARTKRGGLGGFVPPLVMGYVYGRTDSYAIGLWMLSVTAALALLLTVSVVRRTAAQGQETH